MHNIGGCQFRSAPTRSPYRTSDLRYFVTGCAGFIGSTLTDRLLADGHAVRGYDSFSTGQEAFLSAARDCAGFDLVRADLLDTDTLTRSMSGCEFVFHLAANADVRRGAEHPRRDLEQNTIATHNVLEAMRHSGVRRIAFTSSGSVYGDATVIPTPEDAPFPVQTSLYGASKLAGEGLIGAYCAAFGFQAYLFRLVSVLGERYTHGHVIDFYRQLRTDPGKLRVLGDGRQRKSYLHVRDCIDGMLLAIARASAAVNVFNLGHDEACEVRESIAWICEALCLKPEIRFGGGERGWVGDSPHILLDNTRLRALGWRPALSIQQAVLATLRYLQAHPGLLQARS
jgi:UDP-glucose 4-epimerase